MDVLKISALPGFKYETSITLSDEETAKQNAVYLPDGKQVHSYYTENENGSFTVHYGHFVGLKETRGRKVKDQEKRDKTINLRVSASDLEILDSICASRAGQGLAFSSRWDVIKAALQEKYYDYNW